MLKKNEKCQEFTLTVAGSIKGYDIDKVLSEGKNQSITYVGEISSRQELAMIYRQHDYILHPSGDFDTFGATVVEGMLCGCVPLIIGKDGGPGWIVEHGISGFIFDTFTELCTFLEQQSMICRPRRRGCVQINNDDVVARGNYFSQEISERTCIGLVDEIICEHDKGG